MYLWVLYPLTMLILELQEGPVQAHLRMLERVHQRARNTWCRVRWSLCLSEVVYEPMNEAAKTACHAARDKCLARMKLRPRVKAEDGETTELHDATDVLNDLFAVEDDTWADSSVTP